MILRFLIFCAKLFIPALFVLVYVFYHYSKDLPDYSQLHKYYPPLTTRIYSADAKLIEEYSRERRIFVPISAVPKSLIEAFIAAEDKNFYSHEGVDVISIARAAINNISRVIRKKRVEGGSTITQQVVKNFLLTSERSFERKIKEAILAFIISQKFTKEQILELYLNQIYLGKGAYGVASSALVYFNKSVEELSINESAVLASLPKAPSQYNPERDYDRAFERKNYVLGRMYEDGYISLEEFEAAKKEPITLIKQNKIQTLDADYYAERVREEVIGMFGEEFFYTAGLNIFTCADSKMQKSASNSLRFGIRRYDKMRGYRGPITKIDIKNWNDNLKNIEKPLGIKNYHLAAILDVQDDFAQIGLVDGSRAEIYKKDMSWAATNLKSAKQILKEGDVILVEHTNNKYFLEQIPKVNGAIMVLDHATGRVLAAEGGYDYGMSKFDRASQANRQPGSLIKPFVYLAALEAGAQPTDIFIDEKIEIDQGPGLPLWKPKNYENEFFGPTTLRRGLEKSHNIITIKVGQFATWKKVADMVKRFGINESPIIVPSIVLGAIETTLSKMVSAYGAIANGGYAIEPHYIEMIKDSRGEVIYKRDYTECIGCRISNINSMNNIMPPIINKSKSKPLIDDAVDYQIISLMMGGIQRGTGRGAKNIKQIIAGKTGTTNQAKDAWFMGFTPRIAVGTYIGYDEPRSLGQHASGATVALPVFVNFMEDCCKNEPSVDFIVPNSIDLVMVDPETGLQSDEKGAIIEALRKRDYVAKDGAAYQNHNDFSDKDKKSKKSTNNDLLEEVY